MEELTCVDPHMVKEVQSAFGVMKKEDTIPTELMKAMSEFFTKLQEDGMLAIALCDNEKGRMKMLGLLQYATREEIKFKHMLNHITENSEVVLTDGNGIDVEDLENTGETFQEVKVEKRDD